MRVLILGVKVFDFVAKDSGDKIQFARIFHVSPDVKERNTVGLVVSELNVSLDAFKDFDLKDINKVPGIYDLDFSIVLDYSGKPQAKLVTCNFINHFDLQKTLK